MKTLWVDMDIEQLRVDGATQPWQHLDETRILEFVEIWRDAKDDEYPFWSPVLAFRDDWTNCWLADGWHRVASALIAGRRTIPCSLARGDQRDAFVAACRLHRPWLVSDEDATYRMDRVLLDLRLKHEPKDVLADLIGVTVGRLQNHWSRIDRGKREGKAWDLRLQLGDPKTLWREWALVHQSAHKRLKSAADAVTYLLEALDTIRQYQEGSYLDQFAGDWRHRLIHLRAELRKAADEVLEFEPVDEDGLEKRIISRFERMRDEILQITRKCTSDPAILLSGVAQDPTAGQS